MRGENGGSKKGHWKRRSMFNRGPMISLAFWADPRHLFSSLPTRTQLLQRPLPSFGFEAGQMAVSPTRSESLISRGVWLAGTGCSKEIFLSRGDGQAFGVRASLLLATAA